MGTLFTAATRHITRCSNSFLRLRSVFIRSTLLHIVSLFHIFVFIQVCYTERIFINGELRYRLGCINKNVGQDYFLSFVKNRLSQTLYEPRCEKTGLRGFRSGPTQTRLYSQRRWLEA